jgi:hypothetical protein
VTVPVLALLLAVKVTTLVVFAGLVEKDAVVPLAIPLAESVTLPANPPVGWIVMVLEPFAPRRIVRLVGEADKV